jgi:putative transposase
MKRRRFGYRRITLMLRREGLLVNHKRVHRIYSIYRKLGLQDSGHSANEAYVIFVAPKLKLQRVPTGVGQSISFTDPLATGRKFRTFTIVDDFSRECIAAAIDFSFPRLRVIEALHRLADMRGPPATIKSENGGVYQRQDAQVGWRSQRRAALHRTRSSDAEQKRREL